MGEAGRRRVRRHPPVLCPNQLRIAQSQGPYTIRKKKKEHRPRENLLSQRKCGSPRPGLSRDRERAAKTLGSRGREPAEERFIEAPRMRGLFRGTRGVSHWAIGKIKWELNIHEGTGTGETKKLHVKGRRFSEWEKKLFTEAVAAWLKGLGGPELANAKREKGNDPGGRWRNMPMPRA